MPKSFRRPAPSSANLASSLACLAEVGIGGVAKAQYGKGQFAEIGFLFAVENLYRGRASSGGSAFALGGGNQKDDVFVGQGFAFEIACAAEAGFVRRRLEVWRVRIRRTLRGITGL